MEDVTRYEGWYVSADEVAEAMREWFTGKRMSAPHGVRFECSERFAATLDMQAPAWPFSAGVMGSFADLTGLMIATRPDMGDGEWQLIAPVAEEVRSALPFGITDRVVREGRKQDGKPTALQRAYWLVDFRIAIGVGPMYRGLGAGAAKHRLLSYVRAHGHDCTEADMKVTLRTPENPLELQVYGADVSVPREPVRYPKECWDWLCHDAGHYEQADPVDDAAVFAGVIAEKRFLDTRLPGYGHWMPDGYGCVVEPNAAPWLRDEFTRCRRQAEGKPLWMIDVRPKR